MEINDNPVCLYDVKAIRLVKARAVRETRPFANALAVTVLENLGKTEANTSANKSKGKSTHGKEESETGGEGG